MKRSAYIPVLAVAILSLLTMVTGCSKLQARDQLIKGVQAYKNAKFEEAIDHFQNAERLDPTLENAPLYLATAYAQQVVPDANTPENVKNAQLAVNAYQQVLAKDPKDLNALRGIAAVYLNTGKTDEAKEWQRKVTRSIRMTQSHTTPSAWSIGGSPTGMQSRLVTASGCRTMAT
jgi:tetratricopeptide (TPR) repeat protein